MTMDCDVLRKDVQDITATERRASSVWAGNGIWELLRKGSWYKLIFVG